MMSFLENLVASTWNRLIHRERGAWHEGGSLDLGFRVVDGRATRSHVTLSTARRTRHQAVIGRTGTGKSYFLRHQIQQDILSDRGCFVFDFHGDLTPFALRVINARERQLHEHLSKKLILIQPADPIVSVGFNPLERESPEFVRIAEFAAVLRQRWSLDHFGARTDELLRNALYVLSANGLTLIELVPFLSDAGFRRACVKRVANAEVRRYFELRYDQASEAMQAVMREPILNKTSAFTADPHFRHIIGQQHSTFSFREAMDEGHCIIADLPKGLLGEHALTLASLLFTMLKDTLFTREKRSLFTVYCDEIQNLVSHASGIETVLSEARKFGVAIVTANQFLEQYPAAIRAAILAVGTHAFFQLSGADAAQVAQLLDGGRSLTERLKNLPQRHCIVKSGPERWIEVEVPTVLTPQVDPTDLVNRSRYTRGRVRAHIERDIAKREESVTGTAQEVLHDWE